MNKTNPSVDGYLRKSQAWQAELKALRAILLDTPLVEEVKWRVPCYTFEGKNVAFIGRAKAWCALSFVKGALLKDAKKILIQQTENSQSVRIIRFTDVREVETLAPVLKAYLLEAIAAEQAGLTVKLKTTAEFTMPDEFKTQLDANKPLKKAFDALTPGRQRAYLLHFNGAKQSKTRSARVEKWTPHILKGKGIDDE